MGQTHWSGMAYVAQCLMRCLDAESASLWVADAHGELILVSGDGTETQTTVRTPAQEDLPPTAVLAVQGGPDRRDLQQKLDEAAEALSTMAVLQRSRSQMAVVEGILEAVGEQAAVLDAEGTVVRANSDWLAASQEHRAVLERSPIGTHYPSVLKNQKSRSARVAALGVQAVLDGALPSFQSDYDTDVDTGDRSYSLQVDPIPTGGAVVRHVDISFSKHMQRELAHRATHDPLTGLPNRMVMMERLEQALVRADRMGTRMALLFCDVDRFKQINDTLGHAVGDQVLAAVGSRLQKSVRQSDVVARFGGDEFVVLIEEVEDEGSAEALANRLQRAASQPITVNGEELDFHLSIGVALHEGLEDLQGSRVEELLAHADCAMYAAKQAGGGAIRLAA